MEKQIDTLSNITRNVICTESSVFDSLYHNPFELFSVTDWTVLSKPVSVISKRSNDQDGIYQTTLGRPQATILWCFTQYIDRDNSLTVNLKSMVYVENQKPLFGTSYYEFHVWQQTKSFLIIQWYIYLFYKCT